MSIAGMGRGTQTGSGDPTTRDPIKRFTIGPDKPVKRASEMPEKERITFAFNPTAPEEWRSTAPVVIQLYASQLMSREEARERLGLGQVKKNETFAPDPSQMTPGQANKITTNPRTQAGLPANKGLVSKPPEQQEKPEEVASGTTGLSMPQLVSDEPIGQPKKKKAKERRSIVKMLDDDTLEITESLS
jgi:hypothetical protein